MDYAKAIARLQAKQKEAEARLMEERETVARILDDMRGSLSADTLKTLAPAVRRIEMFIAGERYTRKTGEKTDD